MPKFSRIRQSWYVFFLLYFLLLSAYCNDWKVSEAQRLPKYEPPADQIIRLAASFDFAGDAQNWKPLKGMNLKYQNQGGKDGNGYIRLSGSQPDEWNFMASPRMPVTPGKKYKASIWAKNESRPENARSLQFKIEFYYPDKKNTRVISSHLPHDIFGRWLYWEKEFEVPEGCNEIWWALMKGTNDRVATDVSFDLFELHEIKDFSYEYLLKNAELKGLITNRLKNVHPRIYLTEAKLAELHQKIENDPVYKNMYQTLLRMAAKGLRQGPPDYDEMSSKSQGAKRLDVQQLWQRDAGDMIPHLAMAYLLSGNPRYLNGAKEWMFAAINYPTWGLEKWDGMDLAAGHLLTGIGLAFDWLYNDLNRNERMQIRNKLSERAGNMARKVLNGEAWWADKYLQNHPWVNLAGLSTTAFALYGLEDEAAGWLHAAHEVFLTTLETLGHDGASHEGYGYWEYGTEFILRYLEMAYGLMNINLYENDTDEHPWLKNSMLYALHLAIPVNGWSNQGSVIDLGNSTRKHWYGPSYILRKLAQRYPRSGSAGLAQWLADEIVEKNIDEPHAGQYLNLLWYEPGITPKNPDQTTSTLYHFEDIGIVDARSNWSGDETQLVVKCGPPLGHEHIDFPYNYGANHVHPDAGHFTIVKGGVFLIKDDGYSRMLKKQTAYHNTLLVDGQGQKGEGGLAFDLEPWFEEREAPKIVSVDNSNRKDVIICDVAPAYPKKLGLRQFDRTVTFYKPNKIEVDDVVAASKNVTFEWRIHLESNGQKVSENHYRMQHKGRQVDIYIDSEKNIDAYIGEFQKDQFIGIVTTQKENQNQIKFTFQLQ